MLSYLIGIPLGIIGALVVLIWMTRHNHGAEPLHCVVLHDPETLDEQWREIWNNGLDPVWNDHFGWIADGPSVIEKLNVTGVPEEVVNKIQHLIFEQGGVRVTRVGTIEDWDPSAAPFAHVSTEDLQALKDDLIAQFDRLLCMPEHTDAIMQRAQGMANDLDLIKEELDRRRLVQKNAAGDVVIDDYPQIGYL